MTLSIDELISYGLGVEPTSMVQQLPDIIEWAQSEFFIVETGRPIVLQPHQKDILRLFTERKPDDGSFVWRNCLYSTIKKSGKTTISAMYARWAAETWGRYQEVYNLGNKLKQAKERAFKAAKRSILLSPAEKAKQWDVQETRMTHLSSGSIIEALPVSGAGEAGGNPSLTVWTELWGFQYDEALLMWDELKPVPTRPLSQRFVDTYAGFEGISLLLKEIWDQVLAGERLHDELPIYGNRLTGWIGYIDTGKEARRMPWQCGPAADAEFKEKAAEERPDNYRRHWENEWANSTDALINIALWDRLEEDALPTNGADVVLAADASVSGDCTALVVLGYDQILDTVLELETFIWTPDQKHKMDYDETIVPEIESALSRYRVLCVAYDPYQLHNTMTQLAKKHPDRGEDFFYSFPQGGERLLADTALVNRIRQGKLGHSGNDELRNHVQNANGRVSGENSLRIVKRSATKPIDGLVAVSMGAWRIAELLANPDEIAFEQGHLKHRTEDDL